MVWRETGAVRNARRSRGQAASTRKRMQWITVAKPQLRWLVESHINYSFPGKCLYPESPASSGGLARCSVGLRGRSALRARHVAGGRALDLGWRNPVAAMWAGRGERCSHLFKVDLLAGGHSGDSTA